MSEDFFESILPPVKAISESQREYSDTPYVTESTGGTDIEKLWEEIYASDDVPVSMTGSLNGSMHNIIQPHSPIISHNNVGISKLIPINNGTMQSPSLNNGKVFIVPSKRKSHFIQETPAKAMRLLAGLESRKIVQAAVMNRNNGLYVQQSQMMTIYNHEEEQEEEAQSHSEVYAQYQPSKLKRGVRHPYPVVESSSLSSVEVPNIRYNLSLPQEVISQGRLSNVQLESVIYACQRHVEMLPNGERAGYLIGDGAGVGKGRTLAAIIYENYILKRKRSVWISVSNDLKHDAERDLRDLGADIGIHALNKLRYAKINSPENGNLKKGVLFSTYASLIGECQGMPKSKYRTRFKQIVQWFGHDYSGVIVFDECHKAKNLMPVGSQKKTKTAELVLKLQEALPQARIIYSSATGASEPRNMAYMTRLGLWGAGTPFKKFEDFVEKLEDKVGAMELVAVDMKQRGMYIARQLSFADVTFRIQEVPFADVKIGEHQFFEVYNESVDLWTKIFVKMNTILTNKSISKKFAKTIYGQYWAAHQRFFKYLCMAGKVQECVRITMEAITQQKCVVIGLQSTGEAKTNELMEESGGELMEFVSCAKGILQSFLVKFFPTDENITSMSKEKVKGPSGKVARKKASSSKKNISLQDALGREFLDKVTEADNDCSDSDNSHDSSSDDSDGADKPRGKKKGRGGVASKGEKEKDEEDDSDFDDEDVEILMEKYSRRCGGLGGADGGSGAVMSGEDRSTRLVHRELLDDMERLAKKLPINTLDDLIRELGGPDFVAEMSGRKGRMVMDVDSGDVTYTPRREMDVTLEQVNMVEKERFNSCQKLVAIISDAASTGISLHADKRYDNSLQRVHITLELPWSADRAIQQFGRTHRSNQLYPPEYVFLISDLAGERRFASTVAKRLESLGALTHGDRRATETRDLSQFNIDNKFGRQALDTIFDTAFKGMSSMVPMPPGIDLRETLETVGLLPKDSKNVSKFLNRILGMHLHVQNALFQYYSDTMDYWIKQAKRNQEYDRGIIDLAKEDDNIFVEETQDFRMTFLGDDIKVQLHRVKNITGMSWRSASEVPTGGANTLDGFYVTKNESQKRIVLAVQKKGREGTWFTMYSPNVGEQTNLIELKSLNSTYRKVGVEDAERIWSEIYSVTEDSCMHMYWYKQCKIGASCDTGCRSKIRYVLSGSIFYVWDIIGSIHKSPQLARVRLNDNTKIIGCIISPSNKDKITEILSDRRSSQLLQQQQQQQQQQKQAQSQSDSRQSGRPSLKPVSRSLSSLSSLSSPQFTGFNHHQQERFSFRNQPQTYSHNNQAQTYSQTNGRSRASVNGGPHQYSPLWQPHMAPRFSQSQLQSQSQQPLSMPMSVPLMMQRQAMSPLTLAHPQQRPQRLVFQRQPQSQSAGPNVRLISVPQPGATATIRLANANPHNPNNTNYRYQQQSQHHNQSAPSPSPSTVKVFYNQRPQTPQQQSGPTHRTSSPQIVASGRMTSSVTGPSHSFVDLTDQ